MKPETFAAIILAAVFAKGCMVAAHEDAKNSLERMCLDPNEEISHGANNALIELNEPGCGR